MSLPGTIITDKNAAADFVRFLKSPEGLKHLDFDMIFADDWRHPNDPGAFYHHRRVKCAEVLIPYFVENNYISGAYVVNKEADKLLSEQGFTLPITINPHMFFAEDL